MAIIIEVVVKGEEKQFFELRKFPIVLGRSSGADITIASPSISRKHLQIQQNDAGDLVVEELGSSNGSYMNNKQLQPGLAEILTTFFPINLGETVSLRLLGEDEAPPEAFIEIVQGSSTLPDLGIPETHTYVVENTPSLKQAQKKKLPPAPKPEKQNNLIRKILVAILLGVLIYMFLDGDFDKFLK